MIVVCEECYEVITSDPEMKPWVLYTCPVCDTKRIVLDGIDDPEYQKIIEA